MTAPGLLLKISANANLHTKEQAEYYRLKSGLPSRLDGEVLSAKRSIPSERCRILGHFGKLKSKHSNSLRWIPVKGFTKYLVFYYVDKELRTVFVIDVLHGARDIESTLSMELEKNP